MALIKAKIEPKKQNIKLSINEKIWGEIKAYCDWAGITRQEDFFEQAAHIVFKKDSEWKKAQASSKKA